MKDYVIYTDSACDIKPETLKEWGVLHSALTLRFNDSDTEYSNDDVEAYDFYKKMREGGVAKTAAVNSETFRVRFKEVLESGKDLLAEIGYLLKAERNLLSVCALSVHILAEGDAVDIFHNDISGIGTDRNVHHLNHRRVIEHGYNVTFVFKAFYRLEIVCLLCLENLNGNGASRSQVVCLEDHRT